LGKDILLWTAQGFGIGRMPLGPGTCGSLVGLLWCSILLIPNSLWLFVIGTLAGLLLSVWICGAGERILNARDPGSIVLDEITAMPLCFVGWIAILTARNGAPPTLEFFTQQRIWPLTIAVFVAFRFFDIVKPWPVRQSQSLRGGWGVTADDALAALYVNAMVLAAHAGRTLML
jgi:phosphatidylglycerophosphatase A